MEKDKNKLSIVDCEEIIRIIMNSKSYTTRKGDIMLKLHNQIQNYKPKKNKVKGYTDFDFHNIDCMISEDGKELGFFKDSNDVRPSNATYINKDMAEHLYRVFNNNT